MEHYNFHVPIQLNEPIQNKEYFEELIKKAQNGCKESQEKLVQSNLKLVINLVNRFKGRERIYEDLFQIGTIGLIKAIERFDITRGLQFSTYAVPLILGEMKRYLRDNRSMKVSRMIQENTAKIKEIHEKWLLLYQKEPTLSELEKETKLKKEDIVLALGTMGEVMSLSEYATQDNGEKSMSPEERIVVEKSNIDDWIQKETIKKAFEQLDEKEREIIILRFFNEKTQQEIGKAFGISQAHVSRMEKTALLKLRKAM